MLTCAVTLLASPGLTARPRPSKRKLCAMNRASARLSVERGREARPFLTLVLVVAAGLIAAAQYRTLDDHFAPPPVPARSEWEQRADYLRQHVLASAGLLPIPEKTPLAPVVFGEIAHTDYRVSKVYFESLPGFFVTGNLYRPVGDGPFPAILSPHGHWAYGRLENTPTASVPGRAINLARQGFVVFTYDAIGYNDSRQLTHTFDGRRERLWGLSLGGLQLWNSIRSLDFLESLPYVNRDAIGATGASGGGTQTFLVAAVDSRVKVAAPVNMISLEMQGGCLCENLPGLRLDTTNVEIAATIAPRPLLMISATGDWTHGTLEAEYPAVRRFYELLGNESRVQSVRFDAPHNYNRDSREAVYAWMARWLQHAPADVKRPEKSFEADPLPDLLVFHQRALPANAVTAEQLTDNWIAAARRQLSSASRSDIQSALRHSLGFASGPIPESAPTKAVNRTVLLGRSRPGPGAATQTCWLSPEADSLHDVRRGRGRQGQTLRDLQSHCGQSTNRGHRCRSARVARRHPRRRRRCCTGGAVRPRHRADLHLDSRCRRRRPDERRRVPGAFVRSRSASCRRLPDRRRDVDRTSRDPRCREPLQSDRSRRRAAQALGWRDRG